MLQTIITAVQNKEVLSFTYEGYTRVVEPHAVGVSTAGHKVLRCFQVGGHHEKQNHNWDLVLLSKIVGLSATGQRFSSERLGYKGGDKGMITIYAQL
ncbi:hypothetical protein GALL_258460 [mine drainage metagenome]|uniref:WYL domain-containing protein n=1 Tax=mine drainage metagenome TaxID=410659 RepID=A0A1J5RA86_9ZZZZ